MGGLPVVLVTIVTCVAVALRRTRWSEAALRAAALLLVPLLFVAAQDSDAIWRFATHG